MRTTLVADVEADGLLFDLTRLWCLSVGDVSTGEVELYADQPGYPPISEGLKRLTEADRVVFHNGFGYDYWVINRLYPGTLRFEQIYDTLVVSRLLNPERSGGHALSDWGDRLGFPKGSHEDWSRFSPEMAEYCVQDSRVTIKVYRALINEQRADLKENQIDWRQSVDLEHKVAFVIGLQYLHGFRLNVDKCYHLVAELRQEQQDIADKLQAIFPPIWAPEDGAWEWQKKRWGKQEVCKGPDGKPRVDTKTGKQLKAWKPLVPFTPKKDDKSRGYVAGAPFTKVKLQSFNPGSRPQVIYRLTKSFNWKPNKLTDTGQPQIDDEVLNDLPWENVKVLARYFRIGKLLGQIADGDNAWLKLERNGRIHGSVNTIGARTHRMSHYAPNCAQVDKQDLRMREVWEADAGEKLVGCDAEGLELRMMSHYLAKYDGGEYGRSVVDGDKSKGTDVHSRTKMIVKLFSRDSAKTFIYALIYGGGNYKLGLIIAEDATSAGKSPPDDFAKAGGRARRMIEEGITGLDKLVALCKKRHKEKGYVIGLDGRKVFSASEHSALNTLLQSAGAIVMKKALALFHFELAVEAGLVDPVTYEPIGFNYCANVHDEVQFSSLPDLAETIGKLFAESIRLAGERMNLRCPLAGAYDIGENWSSTH